MIETFREELTKLNAMEAGRLHVVLVEGESRRSRRSTSGSGDEGVDNICKANEGDVQWHGRTDTNKRVVFSDTPMAPTAADALRTLQHGTCADISRHREAVRARPGMYVLVEVTADGAGPSTLHARALSRTTLQEATTLGICAGSIDVNMDANTDTLARSSTGADAGLSASFNGAMFVESREEFLRRAAHLV